MIGNPTNISLSVAMLLSSASFLFYGSSCLMSKEMVAEFDRYRLSRYRPLIGALEVAGAVGLIAGFFHPRLIAPAAGGLALMMAAGVGVRLSIGDSAVQMSPALFFLGVNCFIFISANSMVQF